MANFGQENNWFNNAPSPIQTDVFRNYGNQSLWFNNEPSPIQYEGDLIVSLLPIFKRAI